jgi:hypothetical protein
MHPFALTVGQCPDGTASVFYFKLDNPLRPVIASFESCGTFVIKFVIPAGQQGSNHPSPGEHYGGITRVCYMLPPPSPRARSPPQPRL